MHTLTSVIRRRSGARQRPRPGPVAPQPGRSVQLGRLGQRRRRLPPEQSQVVLREGAVSLQGGRGALRPPQLPIVVWGILLLEGEDEARKRRGGGQVGT